MLDCVKYNNIMFHINLNQPFSNKIVIYRYLFLQFDSYIIDLVCGVIAGAGLYGRYYSLTFSLNLPLLYKRQHVVFGRIYFSIRNLKYYTSTAACLLTHFITVSGIYCNNGCQLPRLLPLNCRAHLF